MSSDSQAFPFNHSTHIRRVWTLL